MASDSILQALAIGHDASSAAEFFTEGAALLKRTVGGDAVVGIVATQGESWKIEHASGVPEAILRRLVSGWAVYGPELRPVLTAARQSGIAVDRSVLGASLAHSAYYREIALPQRAVDTVFMPLVWRTRTLGVFILGRRSRFEASECESLAGLQRAFSVSLAARPAAFRGAGSAEHAEPLTRAERELVGWVAAGHSNAEIARLVGLSPNTIRNRLAALYSRLGVSNRAELVALALQLDKQ